MQSQQHERPSVPSVAELKTWSLAQIAEYFNKQLSVIFKDDALQKLEQEEINGSILLECAGDRDSFRSIGLPFGTAHLLADLGKDVMNQSHRKRKGKDYF